MNPADGDLRERLTDRLRALRSEFDDGQRMLAELDTRRRELHDTLIRISGAIQVLTEAVEESAAEPAPGASALGNGSVTAARSGASGP